MPTLTDRFHHTIVPGDRIVYSTIGNTDLRIGIFQDLIIQTNARWRTYTGKVLVDGRPCYVVLKSVHNPNDSQLSIICSNRILRLS